VSRIFHDNGLTTYRSLLNNDVLDDEFFDVNVFRIGIRFSVLQKASDIFDGLFGPTT